MRVAPTTTWTTREPIEDFEFQGVEFRRGTTVHLMSASASTDPAVFDPDRFDITVQRERGVGFGGGIHHCLGHFVARTDMGEALPLLAAAPAVGPARRRAAVAAADGEHGARGAADRLRLRS